MSKTTEVIRCAGDCGRTTTDPDKWDPCVQTGETYCDQCWPNRTRRLEPIQFRVAEASDGVFHVYTRPDERSGLSHGWSLMTTASDAAAIGAAVAEEIVYERQVASR